MVVGWLEEHSMCGQEMEAVTVTTDNCGMQSYEWVGGAVEWVGGACALYLIIINVMHISMFRNYSFNFGWNVAKRGRNMERRI